MPRLSQMAAEGGDRVGRAEVDEGGIERADDVGDARHERADDLTVEVAAQHRRHGPLKKGTLHHDDGFLGPHGGGEARPAGEMAAEDLFPVAQENRLGVDHRVRHLPLVYPSRRAALALELAGEPLRRRGLAASRHPLDQHQRRPRGRLILTAPPHRPRA